MTDLLSLEALFTLAMLIFLQAVLGFDNLLYISIESKRAPAPDRAFARRVGVGLAIALRLVLLGKLREHASAVRKLTQDSEELVRANAAAACFVLGGAAALDLAQRLLTDTSQSVRRNACWGLRELGPAAAPAAPTVCAFSSNSQAPRRTTAMSPSLIGFSSTSRESMTAGVVPVTLLSQSNSSTCRGRPRSSGLGSGMTLMKLVIISAGSRMRKQFVMPSSHSRSMSGVRWCDICFWYQSFLPPGIGPVRCETTSRQSRGCDSSTSCQPG